MINLSPAKWIWLPSKRCLPNTFVLFRRELTLPVIPQSAVGWITADSRYKLFVNGERVQWGPGPCDPRWLEVDPVDIRPWLRRGKNVIGIEVCYFGHGDGTWAMGAPGLIFRLEIDGQLVVSDSNCRCFLDRSHRPGMYKRWFLRSLQDEFDARQHPFGWNTASYETDDSWMAAQELRGEPSMPAVFAGGPEYNIICDTDSSGTEAEPPGLVPRQIPLLLEAIIPAEPMHECGRVHWKRHPDDWFESRMPNCFEIAADSAVLHSAPPGPNEGHFFTYKLTDQVAGFPRFEIEAEAGTIIDLMVVEGHDEVNGPKWLDTYFYNWSRFICQQGHNVFETFDYESFKWIQLHVRGTSSPFKITNVGVRRRVFDFKQLPQIGVDEPALQRLFDASINTVLNCAQETNQDGGGRERQQYSGDCGHVQHVVRLAFGETRHGARYLNTYSQGVSLDGYFMDCWPGFDRLARVGQRQVGATVWGPLLDHGVGFNFDCWHHYLESGKKDDLRLPYPRLQKFAHYLKGLVSDDGLLPVENIGVPTVWLDHFSYRKQSHKRCAFNLYASAMFQHAYPRLAELFGDEGESWRHFGRELQARTVERYWDAQQKLFVIGDDCLCDRSLATAILYDQCPSDEIGAAIRALAECPARMGLSYPANAIWRYWALCRGRRPDIVLQDLRAKWATMPSVLFNNTLQEDWVAKMDANQQFSHCPLAPLIILFQGIAGIRPTQPGFAECEIEPMLGDLAELNLTAWTPLGPIRFQADQISVTVSLPEGCGGTFIRPDQSRQQFTGSLEAIR